MPGSWSGNVTVGKCIGRAAAGLLLKCVGEQFLLCLVIEMYCKRDEFLT